MYAYFLPNGSALVEIVPWNFDSGCPLGFADYYFGAYIEADGSVGSGYFRWGYPACARCLLSFLWSKVLPRSLSAPPRHSRPVQACG